MAATVQFHERNGATGTPGTNKTGGEVRFKNADNPTTDLVNPLVIPSAGQRDHSFEKALQLTITGGTFTQISDPVAYSDGTNAWTGVDLYYAVDQTYAQPVEPSAAQDPPQHAAAPMTSFFTATQGAPIDMDPANAGPWTDAAIGTFIGAILYLVMTVRETATSQVLAGEPISFSFSEIS